MFVSPPGAGALDSSKDSAAATSAPPPPKNAARMLALALAESAQQVSMQSQPWFPGPVSQEASDVRTPPPSPPSQPASTEGAERRQCPSPKSVTCLPPSSSPPVSQPPLESTSMMTKSSTAPPGGPRGADCTPPDTPLSPAASLMSPTCRSPERQHSLKGQVLVPSTSTGSLGTSCKDARLGPQPVPEVGVLSGGHSAGLGSVGPVL